MTLASVTANVFTAAGWRRSQPAPRRQLPAVDGLVTADLAKRLVALEETTFLTGSGSGQPLGILNTPGISTTSITDTGVSTTGGLLDKILDAILTNQTNFGQPSAILMHPRTWTRIIKDKNAQGYYTLNDSTSADITRPRPAGGTLFGVQVVLSNRVPINLGGGTNESRVIVGDFREALILDRQGITVDESPHVYFTTNQTVFRAEFRVGFTAARTRWRSTSSAALASPTADRGELHVRHSSHRRAPGRAAGRRARVRHGGRGGGRRSGSRSTRLSSTLCPARSRRRSARPRPGHPAVSVVHEVHAQVDQVITDPSSPEAVSELVADRSISRSTRSRQDAGGAVRRRGRVAHRYTLFATEGLASERGLRRSSS